MKKREKEGKLGKNWEKRKNREENAKIGKIYEGIFSVIQSVGM